MAVRWARAAGASLVTVIDTAPLRLEAARRGGATVTVEEPVEQVTLDPAPDVVIDCTGNAAVFSDALRLVNPYGRVVVLGDVGRPSDQHLTSDVMVKALSIVGAPASHVRRGVERPAVHRLFFELAQQGRFPVDGLVTHCFENFPRRGGLRAGAARASRDSRHRLHLGIFYLLNDLAF
jgi:threonine dehydrogenase-like Zn-dependent dehydrogenase